jgi:hypothetical protein
MHFKSFYRGGTSSFCPHASVKAFGVHVSSSSYEMLGGGGGFSYSTIVYECCDTLSLP